MDKTNVNVNVNERVDRMGTNIYSSKDNKSLHKSLNGEFILYQILLKQILEDKNSFLSFNSSLVKYFKPDDPKDKNTMNEFDNEYKREKSIHWYTRDTCIYKILNKSLRTLNIDDIKPFQHFIKDLNQQLTKEHSIFIKKQKTKIIKLYRGQFINKDEFKKIKKNKEQFISMNSFLSTSTNRNKALEFALSKPPPNDQLTPILLEIEADIQLITKPYADIKHRSAFPDEEEILFMFGSIFRIDKIDFDEQNNIWITKLKLSSENDQDFKDFSSNLEKELNGLNLFISIGNYFIQMQKYEEAEEHFRNILKNKFTNDHIQIAYSYYGIYQVYEKKQNYKEAIKHLHIVLDYLKNDSNHPLISQSYNDLGSIYTKQSDYILALQSYEKALSIENNVSSITYQGLSQIHFQLKNFILAKEYLQKSLDNQQENDYASIANNYIEMGKIHMANQEKEEAQQMFDKAMKSQLKIVPLDHPDLSYTYIQIGLMYSQMNDDEKAFEYIDKAYQIQQEYLPNNHSDFTQIYKVYSDIYMKQRNFNQALFYQHKTLENQLKTLLWNHPSVAETYQIIGSIHLKRNDIESSLICYHKVLDSELARKEMGDPTLNNAFKDLAEIYFSKDDLNQSLIFYHKLLDNQLYSKLNEDISLVPVYRVIGEIYSKQRILNKSLIYYYRLIDCYLQKSSFNIKTIHQIYHKIGKVYLKKHDFIDKLQLDKYVDIHFVKRHLDETILYFEKMNSQSNDIYRILGIIYFEINHLSKSLNNFLKLLNNKLKMKEINDPSLSNFYKIIGKINFDKQFYNQSLIYFHRLIDCQLLQSNLHSIYQFIGKIYLRKDNINQSSNYINQLINNQSKNYFQFEQKHFQFDLFYFENLLKNKSFQYFNQEQIYFIIANLYLEKQDFNQALIYFQKLISFTTNINSLAQIHLIIAQIYEKQSNFHLSLQNYRQSLYFYQKMNPFNKNIIKHINYLIKQLV